MLRDWQTLLRCLDADVCSDLPPAEVQDLASLLACCVQAASEAAAAADGDAGAGGKRGGAKRRKRKADADDEEDCVREASLALVGSLGRLLKEFSNDPHVVRIALLHLTQQTCDSMRLCSSYARSMHARWSQVC